MTTVEVAWSPRESDPIVYGWIVRIREALLLGCRGEAQ
jgi:hypothetical protein